MTNLFLFFSDHYGPKTSLSEVATTVPTHFYSKHTQYFPPMVIFSLIMAYFLPCYFLPCLLDYLSYKHPTQIQGFVPQGQHRNNIPQNAAMHIYWHCIHFLTVAVAAALPHIYLQFISGSTLLQYDAISFVISLFNFKKYLRGFGDPPGKK